MTMDISLTSWVRVDLIEDYMIFLHFFGISLLPIFLIKLSLIQTNRRSLFTGQKYIGYNASKQAWFTGLKVHVLTTFQGKPREFLLTSASTYDLTAFKKIYLGSLLKGSIILGDKAYISSEHEKVLIEKDLHLITERRKNSRKGQSFIYHRYGRRIRKKIESTFSRISSWLPKHIHAVTDRGFVLKLMMLIPAFSITFWGSNLGCCIYPQIYWGICEIIKNFIQMHLSIHQYCKRSNPFEFFSLVLYAMSLFERIFSYDSKESLPSER